MKHKALVADDEKIVRQLLELILKKAGFSVTLAEDGDQALKILTSDTFHLVITDLQMGKTSGLEVVRKAKARRGTIVIMITGCCDDQYKREAFQLGADDVLFKPFSTTELFGSISLHEQNRKTQRRGSHVTNQYRAAVSG